MAGDKAGDDELVNFSQDYEINHILSYRYNYAVNENNRAIIRSHEKAAKAFYGRDLSQAITHTEFYAYLETTYPNFRENVKN